MRILDSIGESDEAIEVMTSDEDDNNAGDEVDESD